MNVLIIFSLASSLVVVNAQTGLLSGLFSGGAGGAVSGVTQTVSALPLVGGLTAGLVGSGSGSTGGVLGGVPIVGDVVSNLGQTVGGLPIVGGLTAGLVGSGSGSTGGVLGGVPIVGDVVSNLGQTVGGLPIVGGLTAGLVGSGSGSTSGLNIGGVVGEILRDVSPILSNILDLKITAALTTLINRIGAIVQTLLGPKFLAGGTSQQIQIIINGAISSVSALKTSIIKLGCGMVSNIQSILDDFQILLTDIHSIIDKLPTIVAQFLGTSLSLAKLLTDIVNCIISGVIYALSKSKTITNNVCEDIGYLINLLFSPLQVVLGGTDNLINSLTTGSDMSIVLTNGVTILLSTITSSLTLLINGIDITIYNLGDVLNGSLGQIAGCVSQGILRFFTDNLLFLSGMIAPMAAVPILGPMFTALIPILFTLLNNIFS